MYNIVNNNKVTIGIHELKRDGHPTILKNQQKLVYDSYRDKLGYQSLNLFDFTTKINQTILKTYIPNKYSGEFKCDLHPRLNKDNSMISIDLVHNNRRAMGIIKI